jgi:hypothetical protein
LAGVLASADARAQENLVCQYWGPPAHDGESVTRYWRVVLGSAPRLEIPGKPDRTWCSISFAVGGRGLHGAFKSFVVIEAPKNGQFRVHPTSVSYKGMAIGKDRLVVKETWLHPFNNSENSATLTIEIEVVDHL